MSDAAIRDSPSRVKVRQRSRRTLAFTLTVFIGMLVLFAFLGTLVDQNGTPIVQHFSPIVVQTITTVGIVIPTVLPYLIRTHKDSAEAKEQVANSHATNLRDESDDRHREIMQGLAGTDRRLGGIEAAQIENQLSLSRLWSKIHEVEGTVKGLNARQGDLEDTINPRKDTR